jgi:hypothetical protein
VTIRLNARIAIALLAAGLALLTAADVGLRLIVHFTEGRHMNNTLKLFAFPLEANIPTVYSAGLMLIGSVLAFLVGGFERARRSGLGAYWLGVAVIFLFLSVDELAQLHETLGRFKLGFREDFAFLDLYSWIWFYAPFILLFAALSIRFLLRMPRRIAGLIVLGGIITVAGKFTFELIGAYQRAVLDIYIGNLVHDLRATAEEFCKMLGVLIFDAALLLYLARYREPVTLLFTSAPQEALAGRRPPLGAAAPIPGLARRTGGPA